MIIPYDLRAVSVRTEDVHYGVLVVLCSVSVCACVSVCVSVSSSVSVRVCELVC